MNIVDRVTLAAGGNCANNSVGNKNYEDESISFLKFL